MAETQKLVDEALLRRILPEVVATPLDEGLAVAIHWFGS